MVNNSTNICKANNQQLRYLKQPTVTLPQTNNSYVTSNNQQLRYLKQTSVTLPQTTNSYVTSNNQQLRYLKQPTVTLPQTNLKHKEDQDIVYKLHLLIVFDHKIISYCWMWH